MASFHRQTRTTTRVEYIVPASPRWGACWVEVMKAVRAAHAELGEEGRIIPGNDAPDDMITIAPGDECVVVSYETEQVRAT
jgi:hypothetical protein